MDEGHKCVLAIVAGIPVARQLKNPEDINDSDRIHEQNL
jgi:hypothetical protein